jgi:hypothetical protein
MISPWFRRIVGDEVLNWCESSKWFMRCLFVVFLYPVFGCLTNFGQFFEQIAIEYLGVKGPAKSLDKGAMLGFAGFEDSICKER